MKDIYSTRTAFLISLFSAYVFFIIISTYQFNKDYIYEPVEHKTIQETKIATWYNYDLNRKNQKCLDDNCYSMFNSTCASRDYSKGTILLVTNISNGLSVECRVNDYIEHPERDIDLSSYAFSKISNLKIGILKVRLTVVSSPPKSQK